MRCRCVRLMQGILVPFLDFGLVLRLRAPLPDLCVIAGLFWVLGLSGLVMVFYSCGSSLPDWWWQNLTMKSLVKGAGACRR